MQLLLLLVLAPIPNVNSLLGGCFVANGDCPNSNVTFWLYSRATRNAPKQIDPVKPKARYFRPQRNIRILIHGYTGDRNYLPMALIRNALLDQEDVYVLGVDYARLAPEPCYLEAVRSLPLISKCLAQLINNLIGKNLISRKQLQLIGFSLGSQVAGQTANYVKHKLEHITGLDPAKPLFVQVPRRKRLDAKDARFVDVVHTNTLQLGILHAVGHADFYVNLEKWPQPGCEDDVAKSSCSHLRSALIYAESISSRKGFWAAEYGKRKHVLMGYRVSKSVKGNYFLSTASKSPFALGKPKSNANLDPVMKIFNSELTVQLETALEKVYLLQQIQEMQNKTLNQ